MEEYRYITVSFKNGADDKQLKSLKEMLQSMHFVEEVSHVKSRLPSCKVIGPELAIEVFEFIRKKIT